MDTVMKMVGQFRWSACAAAVALALGILLPALPGTARANGAQDVVRHFHENLMPVLGAVSQVPAGQRATPIRNAVNNAFHMPLIGRLVIGPSWKKLDRATKQRLVDAILKLNVATYLNRLGNERLLGHRIDGIRDGANGNHLVDATIDATTGPMRLTYVTRQLKGRWWIIDVLLDGQFSELEIRRNEYRDLLAQSGVPGLIHALERQTAELDVGIN